MHTARLRAWMAYLLAGACLLDARGATGDGVVFEGRTLAAWLQILDGDPGSAEVARAVRALGPPAWKLLVADLGAPDPDGWYAQAALRSLGEDAMVLVPDLVAELRSARNARAAAWVLRGLGESACTEEGVELLAKWAIEGPPEMVSAALQVLGGWGPDARDASPSILQGLDRLPPRIFEPRSAHQLPPPDFFGTLAIVGVDSRAVLHAMLRYLDHGSPSMRLGDWCRKSRSGEVLLEEAVLDASLPIAWRITAIRQFQGLRSPRLLSRAAALLAEPDLQSVMASYLHGLGPMGWAHYPEVLDAMRRRDSMSPRHRQWFLATVGSVGQTMAEDLVPRLLPLSFEVRSPYMNVQWDPSIWSDTASATQYALIQLVMGTDLLPDALRHPDWEVRNAGAAFLTMGGPGRSTDALEALDGCLRDEHPWVRLSAAAALSFPGGKRTPLEFEIFLASAADRSLPLAMRQCALFLLGRAAQTPETVARAVAVMGKLTSDPDPAVARTAAERLPFLKVAVPGAVP